ncbi:MAG: hypothetical protein KDD94_08400, partial [Calditrichaeota bacterium]|nr:hypothetical protein [Calditrichota bacterium]
MRQFILMLLTFVYLFAENDNVPGKKQVKPILLKGGTVHIGNGTVMQNSDVLFDKGRIVRIGQNLQSDANTEVIDVNGKHVYPGLISTLGNLGIVEISSVRATRDYAEVGQFTPEVLSAVAYNPYSEILPVVRAHGITTVMTQPYGGLVSGRSSIINLDAWTVEDGAESREAGLIVRWP